jgi:ATP-dependent Zn protease
MKRKAKRDRRSIPFRATVAMHEAAHAVSAFRLYRRLLYVTINPDRKNGTDGYCLTAGLIDTKEQIENEIIHAMAGMAAEIVIVGISRDEAEAAAHGDLLSLVGVFKKLRRLGVKLTDEHGYEMGWRARKFVREYRVEIETLAGVLMSERTLHLPDVMRVLS